MLYQLLLHNCLQAWERLRGDLDENGRRSTFCPSGLHPDGTCSCESLLMSEESTTRASISRIVMLAEALFEVLTFLYGHAFTFHGFLHLCISCSCYFVKVLARKSFQCWSYTLILCSIFLCKF